MFTTEQEMSEMFEKFLKTNFGNSYLKEYQGLFGIPDFVIYSKQQKKVSIVSFELKLKDWKRASKQAFRYKSFSDIAYVVLSAQNASTALNHISHFEKYNIGLAKFDTTNELEILFKPKMAKPYSENLSKKILSAVSNSRKKTRNIDVFINEI